MGYQSNPYLVSDEAESSQLWLEVPQHDIVVPRPGSKLLQVRAKSHGCEVVRMSAEGPLQSGVPDLISHDIRSVS